MGILRSSSAVKLWKSATDVWNAIPLNTNASTLRNAAFFLYAGGIMHSVTLGDVNSDSYIDVVVGISLPNGEGQVWALNAATGEPLDGFPVGLGNRRVGQLRVIFAVGWCIRHGIILVYM